MKKDDGYETGIHDACFENLLYSISLILSVKFQLQRKELKELEEWRVKGG